MSPTKKPLVTGAQSRNSPEFQHVPDERNLTMLQLERATPTIQPPQFQETALTWLPIYQSVVVYRQSPELILVEEHGTSFLFSCSIINNMTGKKVSDAHLIFNRPATLYLHKSKWENIYFVLEYSEYFNSFQCSCQMSKQYNYCKHRENTSNKTGLPA